ncbi:MAG: hypothetical protein WD071_10750 [Pseudohongiella sp.]|uniref:hypothetical protein n=1 Tax=Pseudohongiella sp. TaxID=1979412 RepID=UPI0034A0448C
MIANYSTVYYDKKNHFFALVRGQSNCLHFVYWHELQKHGIRALEVGDELEAEVYYNAVSNFRGLSFNSCNRKGRIESGATKTIENEKVAVSTLRDLLVDESITAPLIFINCIFEDIELADIECNRCVAFLSCEFVENFRLIRCKTIGDLWLCNSSFKKHFSLKSCRIDGNVHLEGANFTGEGGASFRGMMADNLYLDLGIQGGSDFFWLNELHVPGVVSIGGYFNSEIQLLGRQDESVEPARQPLLGKLIIGKELYKNESANKTKVQGLIRIGNIDIAEELTVCSLDAHSVQIEKLRASYISFVDLSLTSDLIIEFSSIGSIDCASASVGRHLKLIENRLDGLVDLSGSATGGMTHFENNKLGREMRISLVRYTTSRFLFYPADLLFGGAKRRFFQPAKFEILQSTEDRLLGDQYCSLKHWLADTGQLDLEDVAFFHMRDYHQSKWFAKVLLGRIFGWGVRLRNIALSSLFIVGIFSLVFQALDPGSSFLHSISISTQSFISSFFGDWSDYDPSGKTAAIVTFESFLGLLCTTVFVGAYIRKLLR